MLTNEIKRHIDSARQVLVGVVPNPSSQIDQITNALIYKFMDDMDQSAIKASGSPSFFTGDLEKFAWTRLMDTRIGNQDRMNLYSEALIKFSESPQLPELFRSIFKSAFLPYRSPEVLGLFLKEINFFDYSHPEDLGDAYEYLLSIMSSQGDAGQFRTPRHIIDFIVDVVYPTKDDRILDPACGTGGFLISSYKHILEQHDGKNDPLKKEAPLTPDERKKLMNNFEGYDVDPTMVRIAQVNMYLHQFKNPKIYQYNSLSEDERWNDKFDISLANPPFMSPKGGIKPHAKFSIQSSRSEVLFVDYIMSHLKPKGKAGIIVPEGIIFQSGKAYKELRKNLLNDGLYAVVSLPSGVFNPYAGVKTSILLIDKELAKQKTEILFVKIENDGFDLGAQRREHSKNDLPLALKLLKNFKNSPLEGWQPKVDGVDYSQIAHLVAKEKIIATGDYNLSGDRYKESIILTNQKWEMVGLGEIIEIQNGLWKGKKPPYIKVKVLRNTNFVKKTGFLSFDDIAEIDVEEKQFEKRELVNGDIILENSGGSPTQPVGRVAYFDKNESGFSYSNFTSRIRVVDKNICNPKFLWAILLNFYNLGKTEILQSQTSGIKNLDKKEYLKLQIPLPPIEVQKEIVEQIEVKQNAIDHAKAIIQNLEKERRYFGASLRKVEGVEWVELGDENIFEIESGGTPDTNKQEYWNGDINWATLVDLPQNDYITELKETKRKITELGLSKSSAKLLPKNSVLVSSRATIGRIAITREQVSTNQGFKNIVIKDMTRALPYFVAMCMASKIDEMKALATGGTFGEVSKSKMQKLKIPLPSLEIQKKFVAEAEKEQRIINANKQLIEIMEQKISDVLSEI